MASENGSLRSWDLRFTVEDLFELVDSRFAGWSG